MKRNVFLILGLLLQGALRAEELVSEQAALSYLSEKCPPTATSVLKGFASPKSPQPSDVSQVCTCTAQAVQGKSWKSERILSVAAARALEVCTKPVAVKYSALTMRIKFEALFAEKSWTPSQVDVFVDCAAERHWSVSIETARTGRKTESSDVRKLVSACSAQASRV